MTLTVTETGTTKVHGLCYGITVSVIRYTVTVTVTDGNFSVTRGLVGTRFSRQKCHLFVKLIELNTEYETKR